MGEGGSWKDEVFGGRQIYGDSLSLSAREQTIWIIHTHTHTKTNKKKISQQLKLASTVKIFQAKLN